MEFVLKRKMMNYIQLKDALEDISTRTYNSLMVKGGKLTPQTNEMAILYIIIKIAEECN